MTKFDPQFFEKFQFTKDQIKHYFASAARNLEIAKKIDIPEGIFKFSYDALIKIGITLLASQGYKIRSIPGHHIKILEIMAQLLGDPELEAIGNLMRKQRNFDLYDEGLIITRKQSKEYFELALLHKYFFRNMTFRPLLSVMPP
ncbi:hypothetical protein HZA43_03030 [Candidatus Peregrinibacteria bacterium]|nr:hypothetical protein [Candidatus Peregrinibacteria bacterium]